MIAATWRTVNRSQFGSGRRHTSRAAAE